MANSNKENRDISVVTGVFVENENGEVLFVRMPKWGGAWGIPGGHISRNETLLDGALRELEEETGIKADTAELVGTTEMIEPSDFHTPKHFISFQFRVLVSGRPEIQLEERELTEARWMTFEEARKQDDLNSLTRKTLDSMFLEEHSGKDDGYKERCLHAQADYQNLVKDVARQKAEWASWSRRQIVEEFLPVYDNFKKAAAVECADEAWKKGIGYIMKQYGDILKKHGVEEIKTVGEPFDTAFHEAVGEEEGDTDGMILKEADAGYTMDGKVIKVAKVIVARAATH